MQINRNEDYGSRFSTTGEHTGKEKGVNEVKNAKQEKMEQAQTFFAGGWTEGLDIAQKRKEAQEKAMKIVGDVYKIDKAMDDDMESRREKVQKLTTQSGEAQAELSKIEGQREELRVSSGISMDSTQQQDLELLEKRIESQQINTSVSLTEEDKERLAQIDEEGLTTYQKESLRYRAAGAPYRKEIADNKDAIMEENYIIRGMKQARLKSSPMVEANQEADKITQAASAEIIGDIVKDTRENIDDKIEEEEEKKEEAQKQKEAVAPQKDKEDPVNKSDATSERMIKLDDIKKDVQKEVQNIVDEMKLLQEDLKGAAIDAMG